MLRYTFKRLGGILITLCLVSIFVFLFIRMIPGEPARLLLGEKATPEAIEQITIQYGLDKPIFTQYTIWLKGVLTGDFGISLRTKLPVMHERGIRYWNTMRLVIVSIGWSVIAGLIIGIWPGTLVGKRIDYFGISVSVMGPAIPQYWTGLMLITVYCV